MGSPLPRSCGGPARVGRCQGGWRLGSPAGLRGQVQQVASHVQASRLLRGLLQSGIDSARQLRRLPEDEGEEAEELRVVSCEAVKPLLAEGRPCHYELTTQHPALSLSLALPLSSGSPPRLLFISDSKTRVFLPSWPISLRFPETLPCHVKPGFAGLSKEAN